MDISSTWSISGFGSPGTIGWPFCIMAPGIPPPGIIVPGAMGCGTTITSGLKAFR